MIRDILQRTAWLSVGSVLGRAFPLLVLIWLGTQLSSIAYASVSLAFLWGAVAYSLTLAGLSTVVVQRLAGLPQHARKRPLVRRSIAFAIMAVAAPVITILLLGADRTAAAFDRAIFAESVLPAAFAGAAWSLFSFGMALLNGLHRTTLAAAAAGAGGLLQGSGLMAGALLGSSAIAPVWGFTVASIIAAVGITLMIGVVMRSPENANSVETDVPTPRLLSRPLLLATIAAASVTPVNFAAASIAANIGGTTELAAFMALEQLNQLATYVPNILAMAILPVLSGAIHHEPKRLARRLVGWSLALAVGMTLVTSLLGLFAADILRILGNPALNDALALRIMMLNAGLALSLSILGAGINSFGFFGRGLIGNLIWAFLFLAIGRAYADHGVVALQSARLIASWTLIGLGSAMLLSGVRQIPDTDSQTQPAPATAT